MNEVYGRDLDLNLLRVFVVVATARSVTRAAAQLYLTQPAISAALRRLTRTVGAELFTRSGRGLVLTPRGQRLFASAQPLLAALVDAALSPPVFDPLQSDRVMRIGMSDGMEGWFLPRLLRDLDVRAPHMRIIAVPVQFRTIAEVLSSRSIDVAMTVADELPPSVQRKPLWQHVGFVCLFDPRHVRVTARLSERDYFAHEHVIVSYNADLRGVVEDVLHKQRRVRCSVPSFSHIGSLVEGSTLIATLPAPIATHICELHPQLATAAAPFDVSGPGAELLWASWTEDDEACRFLRERMLEVAGDIPQRIATRKKNKTARRRRYK